MKEYTDYDLMLAAQRCANAYAKIANKHLQCNLPIPVPLKFDLCDTDPKTAGRAHATMLVEINMVLFRDNIRDFLNDTIPHEVAHLAQFVKFDLRGTHVQGHGAEWQEIMRRLGRDPQKYHKMDTSKAVEHYKTVKGKKKKASKKTLELF